MKFNLDIGVYCYENRQAVNPKRCAVCHVNESTFAIGGVYFQNETLPQCIQYSPSYCRYRTEMIKARADHSVTSILGVYLIASGGHHHDECLRSVQIFNLVTSNWKLIPSMDNARCSHASCCLNSQDVYVFAGLGEDGSDILSIERARRTQYLWQPVTLKGDLIGPTNCLRAAEVESGIIVLWAYHLEKNSTFILTQDSSDADTLCSNKFTTDIEIPNIHHSSAVCVVNGILYAHDLQSKEIWKLIYPFWTMLEFTEISREEMNQF